MPALMIAGGLGISGCKKKENPAEQTAETSKQAAANAALEAERRAREAFARQPIRPPFEPVTVEEVKPFIPALTGVAPLGEPQVVAGGRRVMALQCGAGNDRETIKAELERKLTEMGFTTVLRPRTRLNASGVVAQKGDLRVSAALRSTKDADCPADQNKTKIFMTYFKMRNGARSGNGADPARDPGAIPATSPPAPASTGEPAQTAPRSPG